MEAFFTTQSAFGPQIKAYLYAHHLKEHGAEKTTTVDPMARPIHRINKLK